MTTLTTEASSDTGPGPDDQLPPPQRRGRATLRRVLRHVVLVTGAIVTLGVLWTLYKAIWAATGGTWPGTSIEMPVAGDDVTMPPFLDIITRFFEPQRRGDDTPLWVYLLQAALFTFREAFVGFLLGVLIGLALALVMLRARIIERGLLPWIIVSQTIPLIALAPIVVTWGNRISLGFMDWQPWMSVAIIATYLTFFPVSVNALRGLQSPTPMSLDLMRSFAATERQTLLRLRFPSSVPYLIPALTLAATASVVGAIVGEISAGVRGGLGRLLIDYSQQYLTDPARLYDTVIMSGLLGLAFVGLVGLSDRLLMRNRQREGR